MKNYTCYLISNKPEFYDTIRNSVYPEELVFFNGEGFPSFSKLVNTCVESCPTEIVILMSYKVLPTADDVKKMVDLIDEGYGLVAMYRLGFFGFKKELMRRIGVLDEYFIGGGGEDDDFYVRLKESDIGCYITEEVFYTPSATTWGGYLHGKKQLRQKWGGFRKVDSIKRQYEENDWGYNLGPSTKDKFLTFDQSVIKSNHAKNCTGKNILK
jgi:hypothetical protein